MMAMRYIKLVLKNPISLWAKWLLHTLKYRRAYSGKHLSIGYMAELSDCQFGFRNTIYENAVLLQTSLGDYSYVGPRSRLANAIVGKFSCIAPDVIVGLGMHPARDFVSIHPAFFSPKAQAGFTFVTEPGFKEESITRIGNDVWVGARAIVLDGVAIGDGAIIGAGSVVTRDVPAYAVVAGVPAKVLRFRFESEEIRFLQWFKWWDRDVEWMGRNREFFQDIKKFINLGARVDGE